MKDSTDLTKTGYDFRVLLRKLATSTFKTAYELVDVQELSVKLGRNPHLKDGYLFTLTIIITAAGTSTLGDLPLMHIIINTYKNDDNTIMYEVAGEYYVDKYSMSGTVCTSLDALASKMREYMYTFAQTKGVDAVNSVRNSEVLDFSVAFLAERDTKVFPAMYFSKQSGLRVSLIDLSTLQHADKDINIKYESLRDDFEMTLSVKGTSGKETCITKVAKTPIESSQLINKYLGVALA